MVPPFVPGIGTWPFGITGVCGEFVGSVKFWAGFGPVVAGGFVEGGFVEGGLLEPDGYPNGPCPVLFGATSSHDEFTEVAIRKG